MASTSMTDVMADNMTTAETPSDVGINVWGLVSVIVFYIVILVVGLIASWRHKSLKSQQSDQVMLAGRSIGLFVGCFTMTATWVGGGYINGTAEVVYAYGLVWAQAPIGYSISLLLGGLFFAKKMRSAGYVTMLDPFERRYGQVVAALLYFPAFLGEMFWSAAILSALGASLAVILRMNHDIAIIISAGVAIIYTVIGGLFSVAFTDVIQLICIFIGLWLGVGFALANDVVESLGTTMLQNPAWWYLEDGNNTNITWLGKLEPDYGLGLYIDSALLLMFGGIPWQAYFQRVLSSRSAATAQFLSFVAAFGCIFAAIPAVLIGVIGRSANWYETSYPDEIPLTEDKYPLILPLVLQYLTPTPVAVIGLGAVSAAVMSSADSSILSSSSMFAKNIYKPIRNACSCSSQASETEILWAMRLAVIVVGVLATVVAISVDSIYGLWFLCSDLVYVILFPQLVCVLHLRRANIYGAISGLVIGLVLRLTGGEPLIGLPPAIRYPWWYEDGGAIHQNFPFKTMAMLISLLTIGCVSLLTDICFIDGKIPARMDVLHGVVETSGKPIIDLYGEKNGSPPDRGAENTGFTESTHF